jgi:hypothetical protein
VNTGPVGTGLTVPTGPQVQGFPAVIERLDEADRPWASVTLAVKLRLVIPGVIATLRL